MPIHVAADSRAKLAKIRTILEPRFPLTVELLGGAGVQLGDVQALIIRADLRIVENISAIKRLAKAYAKVPKRIFVIDDNTHLQISQAYALGASRVLRGPACKAALLAEFAEPLAGDIAEKPKDDARAAAARGEIALASMFTSIATGTPLDIQGAKRAANRIADAVAEDGLSDWLATVRRHHEGTYQHCLLVTGVAVDFGLSLGLSKPDIERLCSAAIFHDVGKAKVPLEVLDKPGRLDDRERALIETHPAAGYEALKNYAQISAEILDAVRHHHEYLDGSGYPDGLCGDNITDIVRILTISDIFSALIENRSYKPPMPRADAYEILGGMKDKLEKPLLGAFRDVALIR